MQYDTCDAISFTTMHLYLQYMNIKANGVWTVITHISLFSVTVVYFGVQLELSTAITFFTHKVMTLKQQDEAVR